jgi:hypothetical protein
MARDTMRRGQQASAAPKLSAAVPSASDCLPASEYLREFAAAGDRAMASVGAIVHDLRIGGARVRLRFAGPALVPQLLPALAHLSGDVDAEAAQPELTIELWDAASTGVLAPRFPLRGAEVRVGEIREYREAGVRAFIQIGERPGDGGFSAITIFDERASIARYFAIAPDRVPWYERAGPLRAALDWGLSRPDRLLVHAGAVGIDGRAVLLAGPTGSGKSTSAVAALLDGCDYLGDDYVLVDLAGPQPVAHSVYATAKLAPSARPLLPRLPEAFWDPALPEGQKHVFDVSRWRGDRLRRNLPILAIVLPTLRTGPAASLRRTSAGSALLALAPSTVFQAARRDGAALRPLADLVRRVPAHVLGLAGGPEQVAPVLAGLLDEAGP